jgi:hypothetical protein
MQEILIWTVKSKELQWGGYVARLGKKRNAYRILVRKPLRKLPSGKLKSLLGFYIL